VTTATNLNHQQQQESVQVPYSTQETENFEGSENEARNGVIVRLGSGVELQAVSLKPVSVPTPKPTDQEVIKSNFSEEEVKALGMNNETILVKGVDGYTVIQNYPGRRSSPGRTPSSPI